MRFWTMICAMLVTLAACTDGAKDLAAPPVALGDFSLGHNVVVAPKVFKSPVSRNASKEQLTTAMQGAIAERFDRYVGAREYHFGISIEGYALAPPGVPLVFAPKSALIINLTVWDDAAGKKLNDKPKQITVLESFGTGVVVGSGYTLTAEEQLEQLARNAAKAVETYLVEQQETEGWFVPDPAASVDANAAAQSG